MINVLNRVYNTPLLVTPQYAQTVSDVLSNRIGFEARITEVFESKASFFREKGSDAGGVQAALIPIIGSLANRGGQITSNSTTMRSYEAIRADIEAAASDVSVDRIILDMDSPGGEATGNYEFSEWLRGFDAGKPIYSFVNGMACSACYSIASSTDRIFTTDSSMLGSVGVVMMHTDVSKALGGQGVDVTFIHSGEYKVQGNGYEPLSDEAFNRFQEVCDDYYARFVQTVADGRGMSEADVRNTEAQVFTAQEAISVGFADQIATLTEVLEYQPEGDSAFSARTGTKQTKESNNPMENEAALEAARKEGVEAGKAEAQKQAEQDAPSIKAEAEKAERERILAILEKGKASNKNDAAHKLAFYGLGGQMIDAKQGEEILALSQEDKALEPDAAAIAADAEATQKGTMEAVKEHLAEQTAEVTEGAIGEKPNRVAQMVARARKAGNK